VLIPQKPLKRVLRSRNRFFLSARLGFHTLAMASDSSWQCPLFRLSGFLFQADKIRELHLQSQLVELRDLLGQTKNEPRLKGPFAFGFYKEVLLSCERIVDRLHSMRCVTARDEW